MAPVEAMLLEPLEPISDDDWDRRLAPLPGVRFYHRSPWLGFLERTGRGTPRRFALRSRDRLVGFFPGLQLKKGPFRLFGSPLSLTWSESMGPVVEPESFELPAFLEGLDRWCRAQRIHQAELGSPLLLPEVMTAQGYERQSWRTYSVSLGADESEMWSRLSPKARNRIRRAQASSLVVETDESPSFPDVHHRQLREVFGRQGLEPPFSIDDLELLLRSLLPQGQIFALRVRRAGSDETLAGGLFPHDDGVVYTLTTASWEASRGLCPNELLHWEVMRLAASRGLREYRMGDDYRVPPSGGRFKRKFGGRFETVDRWVKSYSVAAAVARRGYRAFHRWRRGKWPRAGTDGRV